jgi:RNA polymerase sigma factor (sigma-70 family)
MAVLAHGGGQAVRGVDVGAVYVSSAAKVRRLVRHSVRAPEPVIEDACQTAWTRLVRDRTRVRSDTAVAWLVTTAVREAIRMTRRAGRELFLEDLLDDSGELPDLDGRPATDEVVECRLRLQSLQALPDRQQQFVWLQALGWSYAEIADLTGATPRTIDRQLLRARRALEIAPAVAGRRRDASSGCCATTR